jgi:hypothetical protein
VDYPQFWEDVEESTLDPAQKAAQVMEIEDFKTSLDIGPRYVNSFPFYYLNKMQAKEKIRLPASVYSSLRDMAIRLRDDRVHKSSRAGYSSMARSDRKS